jgi:hypothetical protein
VIFTWTCHVCGEERPDDAISVHKHLRTVGKINFTENVRYCNDRPECVEGAKTFHFVKEEV